ncbi:MAG: hypothetical protein ACLFWL_12660 [Candidatus Brocadiia bacterium]
MRKAWGELKCDEQNPIHNVFFEMWGLDESAVDGWGGTAHLPEDESLSISEGQEFDVKFKDGRESRIVVETPFPSCTAFQFRGE